MKATAAAALAGSLMLLVPAPAPAAEETEPAAAADVYDPLEPLNRAVFTFNDAADTLVVRPAAEGYTIFVPPEIRARVTNTLRNLRAPVILANDLLQGEVKRGWHTFARFVINSTVGLLGLFDPASRMGFRYHDEDFGQTLAVWGVGEGFYLVLPLLGPSNPRDAIGLVADQAADPWTILLDNTNEEEVTYVRRGLRFIDWRSRNLESIDDVKRTSLDYYAAVRSLYSQRRAADIRNDDEDADSVIFFPMSESAEADGGQ